MSLNTESLAPPEEPALTEQPTSSSTNPGHAIWDRIGMFGSAVCIVHCLFTPLAIGYLSALGLGFLGGEVVHKALAFPLLVVAMLAFVPGYRRHRNIAILSGGIAGAMVLLVGIFLLEPLVSHKVETAMTLFGSALLIGAHGANWRVTDAESTCCDGDKQ